jgi:2,4'-dihydroxyacetophenone dioxygenase
LPWPWIEGAQVSFNEDGTFHSVMDAVGLQYLIQTAAAGEGTGPVPYLHGGAVSVIKA